MVSFPIKPVATPIRFDSIWFDFFDSIQTGFKTNSIGHKKQFMHLATVDKLTKPMSKISD